MQSSRKRIIIICLALFLLTGAFAFAWHNTKISPDANQKLTVVAGENFWGSLAGQIGGSKIQLTTVISDPNADPHEEASNNRNARAFSTADYVILNGAGYDAWGQHLLQSGGKNGRIVLTVSDLVGKKEGDNPHFWYNPLFVSQAISQMEKDLSQLSPQNARYFHTNAGQLKNSLNKYQQNIATIKKQYAGTPVAATEDIFMYFAEAAGLEVISPTNFITSVAEGNSPSSSSVAEFQRQLQNNEVKLLVYNKQTETPLTANMRAIARAHNIPVVAITETVQPVQNSFQNWMNTQVTDIQKALKESYEQ